MEANYHDDVSVRGSDLLLHGFTSSEITELIAELAIV